MKGLSLKQQAFCDYYIQLGNATEAAKRAGYSEKTAHVIGHENLSKPKLAAYIDAQLEEIKSKRVADATEVMEYLTSVMRGETRAEVVVVEGQGEGYSSATHVTKNPDEKERIRAAELIGKRHRMWTDKTEHSGYVGEAPTIIDDI